MRKAARQADRIEQERIEDEEEESRLVLWD